MTIILRLIWPYLLRYMTNRGANYAAGFLQTLREQRAQGAVPAVTEASSPGVSGPEILECPPSSPQPFLASDAFWYTLSGILLGSVIGIAIDFLFRKDD